MDIETAKKVAIQLRKPEGEFGLKIGKKMNESNAYMNLFTIKNLPIKTNDKILELGMGNGFFVNEIFKINNQVDRKSVV